MRRWLICYLVCLATCTGVLVANPPDLQTKTFTLDADGFVGILHAPADYHAHVGIIVLGGSEGGIPIHRAITLAEAGYSTLALAYFKQPGLPTHLDRVPLEPALKAIMWMAEIMGDEGHVVLIGGSKGAELALLLASLEPRVGGVVCYAPSHVVFQGIPEQFWPPRSSWMVADAPLPFVPYKYGPHFNPFDEEPDFLALYRESLTQLAAVEHASIQVENIKGPILLFSGAEDRMWPSTAMGDQIIQRLQVHEHPYHYEHIVYNDAGHIIHEQAGAWSEPFGGTAQSNREAGQDALQRTLTLLATLQEQSLDVPKLQ